MAEYKVEIPFELRGKGDGVIVGVLHRHDGGHLPGSGGEPKPLALILHGVLAHKDQLFHRSLAHNLPLDSFRFDFRHADQGGESRDCSDGPGWHMSTFDQDVLDMHVVIKYLRKTFNYHVESIIAHSRGVLDTWTYYWDVEMRRANVIANRQDDFLLDRIPFYVALAGRWDMARMRARFPSDMNDFQEKGHYDWHVRVAGKKFSVKVTQPMVDGFCEFPIEQMVERFPADVDCLLIHGMVDETVPYQDAFAYMNKLQTSMHQPRRRVHAQDLHLIEKADHTFRGEFDAVVDATCSWLDKHRKSVLSKEEGASPAGIAFQARCSLPTTQRPRSRSLSRL
jgi:hypothetical protein